MRRRDARGAARVARRAPSLPLIFLLAVGGLLVVTASLSAQEPRPAPERLVTMDFNQVDIRVLAKLMSTLTQKNFVLDSKVQGQVTVYSPARLTVDEAYQVFLQVLEVNGFTAVPSGKAVKIVPVASEGEGNPAMRIGAVDRAPEGNFYTRVVPLKFAAAGDVQPIVSGLTSKQGRVLSYAPTNSVIVSDYAANIEKALTMIREFDTEENQVRTEVFRLRYADATEVAGQISSLLGGAEVPARPGVPAARPGVRPAVPRVPGAPPTGPPTPGVRITTDTRTNSVLVAAHQRDLERVRRLIADLDRETTVERMRMHVYPLVHANAEEVAAVLNQLVGAPPPPREARPGAPPTAPQVAPPRLPRERVPGEPEAEVRGQVTIVADKATNSVIITASPRDFEALKGVIEKLDVRRRQVLVEALIAELSTDKARELGLSFQAGGGLSIGQSTTTGGGFAPVAPGTVASFPLTGLAALAASGARVRLPNGTLVPARLVFFRALQDEKEVNVLSHPQLLTMDNQEAEILVGDNVPLISGERQAIGVVTAPEAAARDVFRQVERRDVGVILRVTPQITEGEYVRLTIYEEISAVVPATVAGLSDIQISKRTAKTVIVARDDQLIVIGGLIQDRDTVREAGIPFLKDIPLLGYLFKTRSRQRLKTNLYVFLVPHIVRTDEEIADLTRRYEDQIRRFEELQPRPRSPNPPANPPGPSAPPESWQPPEWGGGY